MQVSLEYAEAHLADLAIAASHGEEVEIVLADEATLRLIFDGSSATAKTDALIPRRQLLGALEGLVRLPSADEWSSMDQEIADQMNNSALFPNEDRDAAR